MIDELYNCLKDTTSFNIYRYQDGFGQNDLVVTLTQFQESLFQIRAYNELNNDEKLTYTVYYGLQIPNTPDQKMNFPQHLRTCFLAFKKYEESLQSVNGNMELVLGQILIEPHQLLRLRVLDSDFYKSSLFQPLPKFATSNSLYGNENVAQKQSHQFYSIPPGMPNRVLIYRMQASSILSVLHIMYILPQTIKHKLFDCPIVSKEIEAKICKYAALTGGSKQRYQEMDNPNFGRIGEIREDATTFMYRKPDEIVQNKDQRRKVMSSETQSSGVKQQQGEGLQSSSMANVMNLPVHVQEEVIDLYKVSEQDYYVGEFNDPKRIMMILDHSLEGCPQQMYFQRPESNVFDDQSDDERENFDDEVDKSVESFHFDKSNTTEQQQQAQHQNQTKQQVKKQITTPQVQRDKVQQSKSQQIPQQKPQPFNTQNFQPPKPTTIGPKVLIPRPLRPHQMNYPNHPNQPIIPGPFPNNQFEYSFPRPKNFRNQQQQQPLDQFQHPQPYYGGVNRRQQDPNNMYQAPNMLLPPHFRHPPPFYTSPSFLNPYSPAPQNQGMYFGNAPQARMVPYSALNSSNNPSVSSDKKYKIPEVYTRIPKKTQVKSLLASVNDAVTYVLTEQFKFKFYRHENLYETDETIRSVKIRFTVRLNEQNLNITICGDPDAMRIYSYPENTDISIPLKVNRGNVSKMVLDMNQHITIGSFQLSERVFNKPLIELVIPVYYSSLSPNAEQLKTLIKRLISLSIATMKDIGIKLIDSLIKRPYAQENHSNHIQNILSERRTTSLNDLGSQIARSGNEEDRHILRTFLLKYQNFINIEDLKIDVDQTKRIKILQTETGDNDFMANPVSFQGGFSQVRLMKFMGRDVAVKTMKRAQNLLYLLQQYIILRKLNFDGVPSVYGLFYSYEIDNVCLIIQNVERRAIDVGYQNLYNKTVNKYLIEEQADMENHPFFKKLAIFVESFCFIISNIHRAEVSHCDLSPGNIIVNDGNDKDMKIWIIDFGSALDCDQLMRQLMSLTSTNSRVKRGRLMFKSKGTSGFQAPELLLDNFPRQEPKLTKKIDIYSIGLIVYFLIFRKKLFDQIERKKCSPNNEQHVFGIIKQQFQELKRKLMNKREDRIKMMKSKIEGYNEKDIEKQTQAINENIKLIPAFEEFLLKTLRCQAKSRPSALQLWSWLKDSGMMSALEQKVGEPQLVA